MKVGISPEQLIQILSASIAPVIVISGVGLVLLSMTNRYRGVIDRARELVKYLDTEDQPARRELLEAEVKIIYRRARILRVATILGTLSILFVAITVISLFAEQVLGATVDYFSVPSFGLSMLCLLGSLYFFIRDMGLSLAALELEIGQYIARAAYKSRSV